MANELNRFHRKAKWVDSVKKQDLCVLLKLDNISWPRRLVILDKFRSVVCREYTLPRDIHLHNLKDGFKETRELGLYWMEVTTSFQNVKYGIEIRIWFMDQDNSQLLVRIFYGTIQYVVDSNQNNTEILADSHEDQVPKKGIKVVAAR